MHAWNSLEVGEKTEIQLFSLLCWIGLALDKLTLSRGKTGWAVNPAKGGCVLTVLGLFSISNQGKKLSSYERAIKPIFDKNTLVQTLQCSERVSIGWKLMYGLFVLINDQGQQKMHHASSIGQRMAKEVK